jgi:hypothetical protein
MPLILEYINAKNYNPYTLIGVFLLLGALMTRWMKEITYSNLTSEIYEALRGN